MSKPHNRTLSELCKEFFANKGSYYEYLAQSDASLHLSNPYLRFGHHAGISWIQANWLRSFYNQVVVPSELEEGTGQEEVRRALDMIETEFATFGRPAVVMLPRREIEFGALEDGYDMTLRNALQDKGFLRLGEGGIGAMAVDLGALDAGELQESIDSLTKKLDMKILELVRPSPTDYEQPSPEDAAKTLVKGFGFGEAVGPQFAATLMSAPSGPKLPLRNFVLVPNSDSTSSRAFVTLFFSDDGVAMYNLSCPKEYRGGLGTLLTLHCILLCKQLGHRYLTLQPSPMASKLYAQYGFQVTCNKTEAWLYGSWRMGWLPWVVYWVARAAVNVFAVWSWVKGLVGLGGKKKKTE